MTQAEYREKMLTLLKSRDLSREAEILAMPEGTEKSLAFENYFVTAHEKDKVISDMAWRERMRERMGRYPGEPEGDYEIPLTDDEKQAIDADGGIGGEW